jgi:cytochrome P450
MTDTSVERPARTADVTGTLPEGSPVRDLFASALVGGGDPYPVYRRMRACGVINNELDSHVSRYADVLAVLRDPHASADARNSSAFTDGVLLGQLNDQQRAAAVRRSFLNQDPPDHTRLRRLVARAFTSRRIQALRPAVERFTGWAIDTAAGRGRLDVVADLAYPLPVHTICGMLGIPVEGHPGLGQRTQLCCYDPAVFAGTVPEVMGQAILARDADLDYYAHLVEQRRAAPGDDLISALIAVQDEGDRLTTEELVNTIRLLFIGGHETTVSLIANGMLALLRNPGQLRLLREQPELAGEAVEEALRYDPPFQFARRVAMADLHVNGTVIPVGAQVMVWLAAANRDDDVFPEPDRFDITRPGKRHLAFGAGIHACLGTPLARLQAETVLRALAQRLIDPVLLGAPRYHDDAVRAIKEMPLTFAAIRPGQTPSACCGRQ